MRTARCFAAILFFALPCVLARAAEPAPYKDKPGPHAVATLEADWADAARSVTVPVKIYYPKDLADGKKAAPLVIFSHGLGGSRESYEPYGEHWASQGYVVIHPTHVGSDTSIVLLGNGTVLSNLQAGISAESAQRRIKDVSFIIDQFEKINVGTLDDASPAGKTLAAFKGLVDMKHIGMAGHSFGAVTTLSVAGQVTKIGPLTRSNVEPRLTAAIAMSPQPALQLDQKTAFGAIKIPLFCMTGTADDGPPGISDVKAEQRRVPFDNLAVPPLADDYLVVYQGATHMTFAPTKEGNTAGLRLREFLGRRGAAADGTATQPAAPPNTPAEEAAIHSLVLQSTTAFWDVYLKDDAQGKAWLRNDFAKVADKAGKVEMRTAKQ